MRSKFLRLAVAGVTALTLTGALFAAESGAATTASAVTYKTLSYKDSPGTSRR